MDKAQAKNLVIETFTKAFDRNRFSVFVNNLLNHLDTSNERRLRQAGPYIKKAYQERIKSFERIGTYNDPEGRRLDVLIVNLQKEATLERARTFQRNFVADYLATGHGRNKDAVLAAFVSPTEDDWRFSFIQLEYSLEQTELGFVTEKRALTPARRYSFLVGSNENSHTAQKQFLELLQDDLSDPQLEQIEKAFDIEKVTIEFFEHYKELFETLRKELKIVVTKSELVAEEFDRKAIELDDFAKKLLGQIVFLYFLQKKGWFGVERDGKWGTGNKNFLRYLFEKRFELGLRSGKSSQSLNFFNDILEPLFYEALAIERTEDFYSRFHCKIPFLNGGLFEPLQGYNWVNIDINLPDMLFSNDEPADEGYQGTGILDIFDRYNFTVNEAHPLEKEVAVDPEMLGKVFENLLPENQRHKAGSYYTPRVIVHYMCQQSLINYLSSGLSDLLIKREDIETFIHLGERYADFEWNPRVEEINLLPESIRENASRIDTLLKTIAVCDPAIGSGAFPVGMMQEIVRARLTLAAVPGMRKHAAYELKREAIQNSLYGVDIDPGAVEIAKLRLWLSLIVDEDDISRIEPLPNLDYKIMQGDSLLDEFDGVKLLNEHLFNTRRDVIENQLAELSNQRETLSTELMRLRHEGKRSSTKARVLDKEIETLDKKRAALRGRLAKPDSQIDMYSESQQKLELLKNLHADFFNVTSPREKTRLREKLNDLEWEFMETKLSEQESTKAIEELEKLRHANRKPFFLWKLQFLEIFQEKAGFDIVIANPPYVRMEEIVDLKDALARNYRCSAGRADLYVYFYERGVNLLNRKGTLAFISSNKFFRAGYGKRLRSFLADETEFIQIIDFGDTPIFDATIYPCILILERKNKNGKKLRALTWSATDSITEFPQVFEQKSFTIDQDDLEVEGWRLEPVEVLRLLEKLRDVGEPLGSLIHGKIFYGIKTGLNEAFYVDKSTREELIREHSSSNAILKPYIRGRDISKWFASESSTWLIFTPHGIDIDNYPAIKRHLAKYKPALSKRALSQKWFELQQPQLAYTKYFSEPKIVYPDIAQTCSFAFDERSHFIDCTVFALPSDSKFLLAILNSKVIAFFISQIAPSIRGDFKRFKTQYVEQIPCPPATEFQKKILSTFVDYLLFLKRERDEDLVEARDRLMSHYFDQIINAMVYELFLREELHKSDKYFFKPLAEEKLVDLHDFKGDRLAALRLIFKKLFDQNHILRQNIFFLDTLESVRIIEGNHETLLNRD